MPSTDEALRLGAGFEPSLEESQSRDQTLALLAETPAPFSHTQIQPGHITCSALVLHPDARPVLLVHHPRLRRWLLPGGHVEELDATLSDAARREAVEETSVRIDPGSIARLVGMDVHGIPAHKGDPFHLHHDLIFAMRAESEEITASEEAPEVAWCGIGEVAHYGLPDSIVRAFQRAQD